MVSFIHSFLPHCSLQERSQHSCSTTGMNPYSWLSAGVGISLPTMVGGKIHFLLHSHIPFYWRARHHFRPLKAMNLCSKMKYEVQKHLAKFLSFLLSSIFFSGGVVCPLITEIFIQSYRPAAYVFNGVVNWIQLFILGLVFPFLVVSKVGCLCQFRGS